jgi:hypothetical protein
MCDVTPLLSCYVVRLRWAARRLLATTYRPIVSTRGGSFGQHFMIDWLLGGSHAQNVCSLRLCVRGVSFLMMIHGVVDKLIISCPSIQSQT